MIIFRILLFLLLPISLFSQQSSQQLQAEGIKKYNANSGKIEYEISGDAEGQEILLFDRNGWRSLKKQTITFELQGVKTLQTLHEITDGNNVYRLNGGDSTYITKTDFKWSQLATTNTPDDVSNEILFMLGGNHESDSTLLGKKCQVWTFPGKALNELWIWNQLVLKRKINLGDNLIITTATNINLNATISDDFFAIPSYFTLKK